MTIEIKSIFSALQKKSLTPVLYQMRKSHVTQVSSQMEVWDCDASLYATAGPDTLSVCLLLHDKNMWKAMWDLCKEYYDEDDVPMPDYISQHIPEVKRFINSYIYENCHFFCELPLVKSMYSEDEFDALCNYQVGDNFPFLQHRGEPVDQPERDWDQAVQDMKSAMQLAKEAILEAFELERRRSSEILLFVLSNIDRVSTKKSPLGIPIAYAMKPARSFAVKHMRKLLSMLKPNLLEQGINIIADCYDGQWAQLCFRTEHSEPLTLFELQRDIWSQFQKTTMDKLMAIVTDCTMVNYIDHRKLKSTTPGAWHSVQTGNLKVTIERTTAKPKTLNVTCTGGRQNLHTFMQRLKIANSRQRPDLWEAQTAQLDLLSLITSHAESLKIHVLTSDNCLCDLADYERAQIPSEHILLHTNVGKAVMQLILIGLLTGKRPHKWQSDDITDLYNNALSSGQNINRKLTVAEIELICHEILKYSTHTNLMKQLPNKLAKVNFLARLLRVRPLTPVLPKPKRMETLRNLSMDMVKKFIPVNAFRAAVATVFMQTQRDRWLQSASIPSSTNLPVAPFQFQYFSFPEYDLHTNCIQPKLIDPTHVLTNLRLHCTTKSVFNCDPKAFLRVCDTDKDVLNRAVITQVLDKQSCAIAQEVFSERVQEVMERNGDLAEAELVMHVRRWFDACNKRGVDLHTRLKDLIAMANYCGRFWKWDQFPAPGTHVCGLPYITYQCILQGISTRLQLYHIAINKTYSQRVMSTLTCESLFSDVTKLARQTNGIPLATEIATHIGKMIHINIIKHDPEK